MKKIKSLIYRELVISKKFYMTTFAAIVFFMIIGWLIILSAKIGNLAKVMAENPEFASVSNIIIYYTLNYFTAYVAGALINNNGVILSDIKSNWRMFAFTLPAKEKEKSLAKFIIKAGCIIAALLICIINGLVLSGISDIEFELKNINIYILLLDFWIISDFLTTLFQLRAKNEKEAMLATISPVILIIMLMIAGKNLTEKITTSIPYAEDENMITENMIYVYNIIADKINEITPFAILAMLLFLIGGFFVNMQIIKRRYK